MAGRKPQRRREDQEPTEAREVEAVAGSVSTPYVGGPEDGMRHPPVEYADEIVPGRYRLIANDAEACRAMAAEALDHAWDGMGSGGDIRDLTALANCWMRLSELAAKANK